MSESQSKSRRLRHFCLGRVSLVLLLIISVVPISAQNILNLPPILPPVAAHNPSVPNIQDYGTATVDGVIQSGEYNSCYSWGTSSNGMTFCEKNDNQNDYYAVQVRGYAEDPKDYLYILFDNNHDGLICTTNGRPVPEDAVGMQTLHTFVDMHYCGVPTGTPVNSPNTLPLVTDTSSGGTTDGAGAETYSPSTMTYTFEMSHPLVGQFGSDYSLSAGSTVGYCVYFWNDAKTPGEAWAAGLIDLPIDCFLVYSNGGKMPSNGQPPSAGLFGDITKLAAPQNATICPFKFNDLNGDGFQETGEPAMSGWGFNFAGVSGTVSATTNSTGYACVTVPAPGTYTVSEVAQPGWTQTAPQPPGTITLMVSPNQVYYPSFGNHATGATICVTKYNDLNGNGIQDPGEPGLQGWTINIGTTPVTTDTTGRACYVVSAPGTYTISEVQQAGWTQTSPPPPGTYTVTVTQGQTVNVSFGNQMVTTPSPVNGTICMTKFDDHNGNGVLDSGEHWLSGWFFHLADPYGNMFTSGPTNSTGTVCVSLPPGKYTVSEVAQLGWTQTLPQNPGTYTVFVGSGQTLSLSFGNVQGLARSSSTTTQVTNPGPKCIIATAAYGSELAAPVQFLRNFRENQVQRTALGSAFLQAFNNWYYSWATGIAQRIAPNENYKAATRVMITPLIGSLFVAHALFLRLAPLSPELAVVSAGLLASALIGLAYLAPTYAIAWRLCKRKIGKRTIYTLAITAIVLTFIATLTTGTFSVAANLTALAVVETMLLTPAFILRKVDHMLNRGGGR